jgi:hypothetical protein
LHSKKTSVGCPAAVRGAKLPVSSISPALPAPHGGVA